MKLLSRFFAVALMLMMVLPTLAQDTNTLEGCVTEYDASVDYFPEKITTDYTTGFEVEYFNNYKVVTVTRPWQNAAEDTAIQYVLVQCGTPAPEGFDDATIIEIPVETVVSLSTTNLPYIADYGLLDELVGVDSLSTVTTQSVVDKGAAGELVEVAPNYELNIETILDLDPALVLTYGFGYETDSYLLLEDAGIPYFLSGDFAETDPLGRAEWGKFISLFFNQEAVATELFDAVATDYNELAELAATATEQPTVLLNAPFDGTWYMAGGQTYMAKFIADAGAAYLWADDESASTLYLDFETVFEKGSDADFWVNADQYWFSGDDVLAADERYGEFAAFANGTIWSNNLALTDTFGNDFYETGVAYPNVILADLIAIFHPELLPEHEFAYYQSVIGE